MKSFEGISQQTVVALAPFLDGLMIAAAGWIAYVLRWDTWGIKSEYLVVILFGTLLSTVVFPLSGSYQSWRGKLQFLEFGHVILGSLVVALVLVIVGTITKTTADFSRLWMGYWLFLSLLMLFLSRLLYSWVFHRWMRSRVAARNILLVARGDTAAEIVDQIESVDWPPMCIKGYLTLGAQENDLPSGLPVAGNLDHFPELVEEIDKEYDEIWISSSISMNIKDIYKQLQISSLPVRYIPDFSTLRLISHRPVQVGGLTVIDLNASPLVGINRWLKAVLDFVLAVIILILLSPLLIIISILIKLDSDGPILFKQTRHGWDGKPFQILKFRTMTTDSQEDSHYRQAVKNDPRVTRVGGFLRRTSLDELPQFVNVLRGNMSIVGPRPHPVSLNRSFIPRIDAYMQRHRVKPGITGWAQVNGYRGETETVEKMQGRVELDLYYIEHWSLWLDLKIILQTVVKGWMHSNAY